MTTSALNVYDVVADFGANPTGTTDSSTSIQNAILASQSNPACPVWIPGGNYIAENMSITSQFGGIVGPGPGAALIRCATPNATMFNISNTFLMKIKGLALGGFGGVVQTGGALINAVNSHKGQYNDLELVDMYHGIILNNATNCTVEDVKAFQPYGPDFVLVQNGGAATIEDCQFDNSTYGPAPYVHGAPVTVRLPSHSYNAGDVAIANNCYFIAGNAGTTAAGSGPVISPFGTAVLDGSINWYFLCASNFHPINLSTGGNSNYVRFNDVDGPNAGAISITGSSTNTFLGNTLSNGLRSGIDINSGNDNKFGFNMLQNFPYRGIDEAASVIGSIIAHNSIANIGDAKIKQLGSGGIYVPNVLH